MSNFEDNAQEPLLRNRLDDNFSPSDPVQPTLEEPNRFRDGVRFLGCCVTAASTGWHDGCIGALIPYFQVYYGGVSDEKVSLVFIGSFSGYILASLLNVKLSSRIELGHLLIMGTVIQAVATTIITFRPPFVAIAMCYAIAGFGLAIQDAQFNTHIARLPNATTKLGIAHSIYGLGALSSPIAATLLMRAKIAPPLFYFTNLMWCILSITALFVGFGLNGRSGSKRRLRTIESGDPVIASIRTVVSSRAVWPMLIFIGLYTGAETGEAGWVVSFLMRARNGGTMSGYASSAFYAGLTSSRVMLLPLTEFLTEKRAVALYVALALTMQVVVWISPLVLVDFIAIASCGFVMGPIYPIAVSLITKATPHGYHPGALSLMACFGQSGSALFPFVVGSLADRYGIKALEPVLVTLFIVMGLLWQLVPPPKAELLRFSSFDSEGGSIEDGVL